jgi:hypothetical protein
MLVLYFGALFRNLSGGTEEYYGKPINISVFRSELGDWEILKTKKY